jgi:hypothetical protein
MAYSLLRRLQSSELCVGNSDGRSKNLVRMPEPNYVRELEKFIPSENIGPWLKELNPAFDGSTPLQVVERGEADRIWRMLYELGSGEPG